MIIIIFLAAIIFSVNSVIFEVWRDGSGKFPYYKETPVNLESSPELLQYFIPWKMTLFQDVDGENFETCNQNNQKVFNGRAKGIGGWDTVTHETEYERSGDPVVLALCVDPASVCKTGVSLIGNLNGVSQKLHFTKNSGLSAQLVLRNENNETMKHFSFKMDKFSFGCIVFTTWIGFVKLYDEKEEGIVSVDIGTGKPWATNYTQFISYGDEACGMTLTVVDTDTHSSTKFVCNAPKQESNQKCQMPQWDATPMTDKDTSAINHTVDEILEGQELLLGVISVNPQLAPSPQLVAYDAAGNLFINGGYEQGSVTALLPEAFQIPLQFTKANALLNVAVCVRANSKCIRGGLTLSIGDCNMTVPADSLKPLKESECWIGGWAVKNTRLGDGMVIKYDVPTCRMVAVITSKDIKKCEMDWEPFKIIASDSRVDEKDAMPHEETLEYEQTKSYEEVWSSSNTQEQEDGGKREEEDGQQSGRVDTVGSKETTYEEVTDSEKTNVQWNKENAAPMQMPGLAGAFMSPAQGFLNKMTDGLPPCVKDITNVKNAMNGQDQAIAAQAGVAVSHRGGVVNRAAGATLTALIPLITAGLDFMGKSAGKKDNGDSKGPSNTCGVETLHSQKWGSVDEHKQEVTTTDLQSHKSLRMKYYKSRYTNTQSHAIKYTETAKKIMKTNITVKPGVTYEARQLYIKCGGDAQKWKSPHIRILQYYTDGRRPNETYDNYQNSDLFKGTCVVKNDTCKPVNATDSMSSYNTTDSDISTTDPDKNGEPSIGVAYDWQALISVVVLLLVASHGYV